MIRPPTSNPYERVSTYEPAESGELAEGRREPSQPAAQLAARRLRLSGGPLRVLQLARRAEGVARGGGAVRPVPPHGGDDRQGARRLQDDELSHHQQLREFHAEQGEADGAVHVR